VWDRRGENTYLSCLVGKKNGELDPEQLKGGQRNAITHLNGSLGKKKETGGKGHCKKGTFPTKKKKEHKKKLYRGKSGVYEGGRGIPERQITVKGT